jgi:hypothetical protein
VKIFVEMLDTPSRASHNYVVKLTPVLVGDLNFVVSDDVFIDGLEGGASRQPFLDLGLFLLLLGDLGLASLLLGNFFLV